MTRLLALLLLTFSLTSCASVFGEATQEVTILTPGANDSVCQIDNGEVLYRTWPPQTLTVAKRPGDLVVRCLADGNREKTVVIDPQHVGTTLANVFNGFAPGLFVDYQTGALFEYPNVITVDFTEIAARKMPPPAYHRHLEENPELFGMEEFRSGRAALIRDRYESDHVLKKREFLGNDFSGMVMTPDTQSESGDSGATGGEQDSSKAVTSPSSDMISDLTRRMNPQVFGPSSESSSDGFTGGTAEQGGEGAAGEGPVQLHPYEKP